MKSNGKDKDGRTFTRRGLLKAGAFASVLWAFPYIKCSRKQRSKKLIYIAIDSLHPDYLSLDVHGNRGGKEGNWLMPNMRRFIERSLWYPYAKDYLPAATDMNHINALAGTSVAQTGCYGVSAQIIGWDKDGKIVGKPSDLNMFRDDRGRPVDTLFHAWKRQNPRAKTAFISGKPWVAEMFRSQKVVDVIVTGLSHPEYLPDPSIYSIADPSTDEDGGCDPEGRAQKGTIVSFMNLLPGNFPTDEWVVHSALEVFRRENPDLTYILLASADESGHALGACWNPEEFFPTTLELSPGCGAKESYTLASKRNPGILKEPILDAIREVDHQFGVLIRGLEELGVLDQAMVCLLSDHSMINHLASKVEDTDIFALLEKEGLAGRGYFHIQSVTSYALLYWRENKEKVRPAKELLLSHRVVNPETGVTECPFWVLNREDLKNGVEGLSLPGELYHPYFYEDPESTSLLTMPDLQVYAKNGWQIPVYGGTINNLGIQVPEDLPPQLLHIGGHGSSDTQSIVFAIWDSSLKKGRVVDRPVRISDLAVTARARFGLELLSTTVGKDLSEDFL